MIGDGVSACSYLLLVKRVWFGQGAPRTCRSEVSARRRLEHVINYFRKRQYVNNLHLDGTVVTRLRWLMLLVGICGLAFDRECLNVLEYRWVFE